MLTYLESGGSPDSTVTQPFLSSLSDLTNQRFDPLSAGARLFRQAMSTNDYSEDKGSASTGVSAAAQAPKLRSGAHYAAWRRDMEVWLERHNASGVHTRAITPTEWKHLSRGGWSLTLETTSVGGGESSSCRIL